MQCIGQIRYVLVVESCTFSVTREANLWNADQRPTRTLITFVGLMELCNRTSLSSAVSMAVQIHTRRDLWADSRLITSPR